MSLQAQDYQAQLPSPIYIISGGTGTSGELLVNTVLAQFPEDHIPIITFPHVRQREQIEDIVNRAARDHGTIVYTLIDSSLRDHLFYKAKESGTIALDLMGPLINHLSALLHKAPLEKPGLYRQLHKDYFERVSAIEFTIAHDDGLNPQDWPCAEIILIGVSRVGKTPLSIFLSVLGWKVANTPLILGLPSPQGLFDLDYRRVIGLSIEADKLFLYRQQRQTRIGFNETSPYTDLSKIREELEASRKLFRQGGFSEIDVTHMPIEASANEIIKLITSRFKKGI